jgi:cytochrome c peroxidase
MLSRSRTRLLILPAAGFAAIFLTVVSATPTVVAQGSGLTAKETLGKMLFFDTNLSSPKGQACASCHGPGWGFTGPDSTVNATTAVFPGAIPERFGNRKPPTAAYAFGPVLHFDDVEGLWIGGTFWDGRAAGLRLGDPLAEQALAPFLNPVEQNMASQRDVCEAVLASAYADLFRDVWGGLDCLEGLAETYDNIGRSISAYERSMEVSPFSSKFDAYRRGEARLTGAEMQGLRLFEGKAKCALCHLTEPGPGGEPPMFTDFTFDNLGVPKNPRNPFYAMTEFNPLGANWIDLGLGGFLASVGEPLDVYSGELGKQKVPTLRNVDRRPSPNAVKAFTHNGYFTSLEAVVHFYNTRDVLPACESVRRPREGMNCWPAAEVPETVNTEELGNLGLTPHEEQMVVKFLETLSDGYGRGRGGPRGGR